MSSKCALLIVAVAVGSFTVGSQAMALNPQPLPPRWSHAVDMRKAGGSQQEFKVQSRVNNGDKLKSAMDGANKQFR